MNWWKPRGNGCYVNGEWSVVKNWNDTKWTVYRNDKPVEGPDYDDAQKAIDAAEAMEAKEYYETD